MEPVVQNVCKVLFSTLSGDDAVRKPAEIQLSSLQQQAGFSAILQGILEQSSDITLKHAAVLSLLKVVKTYWNTKSGYSIAAEEKASLRQTLMNFLLREEPKIISDQIENILSHVILYDFPEHWPDVFNTLTEGLSSSPGPTNLLRITETIYHGIRQITTKPESIPFDDDSVKYYVEKKAVLCKLAPAIFGVVSSHWLSTSNQMLSSLSGFLQGTVSDESLPVLAGKQCSMSLKVIRLLFKHYFDHFGEQDINACISCFKEISSSLYASIECKRAMDSFQKGASAQALSESLELCILTYLKIINVSQDRHPLTFVPVLEPFMKLRKNIRASDKDGENITFWEKYVINLLYFFSTLFSRREYAETSTSAGHVSAAGSIVQSFFTPQVKMELVSMLIVNYLQLMPTMLSLWKSDPESFIDEELAVNQSTSSISSAEDLFYRLIRSDNTIAPNAYAFILNTLKECHSRPQDNLEVAMIKDACYHAFGIGCSALRSHDAVNFRDFFLNACVPEFKTGNPLLQRRIAAVIIGWSSEIYGVDEEMEDAAYRMCLECLNNQDLVLRVYGALAIQSLLEQSELEESTQSTKYLQPFIHSILNLIEQLTSNTLVTTMLQTISLAIESVRDEIKPFVNDIMTAVSNMWQKSQHRPNVLSGIISIINNLVASIGGASGMEEQLLPIVMFSCTVSDGDNVSLIDEGLQLWSTLVQFSQNPSQELLEMVPRLLLIMQDNEGDSHIYNEIIKTVEGLNFLNVHGATTVQCLLHGLDQLQKNSVVGTVIGTVDLLVTMFPKDSPLVLSECLKRVLEMCAKTCDAPKAKASFIRGVSLFSRILLDNPDYFFGFMAQASESATDSWIEMVLTKLNVSDMQFVDLLCVVSMGLSTLIPLAHAKPNLSKFIPKLVEKCVEIEQHLINEPPSKAYPESQSWGSVARSHKDQVMKSHSSHNTRPIDFLKQHFAQYIQMGGPSTENFINNHISPQALGFLKNPPSNRKRKTNK